MSTDNPVPTIRPDQSDPVLYNEFVELANSLGGLPAVQNKLTFTDRQRLATHLWALGWRWHRNEAAYYPDSHPACPSCACSRPGVREA